MQTKPIKTWVTDSWFLFTICMNATYWDVFTLGLKYDPRSNVGLFQMKQMPSEIAEGRSQTPLIGGYEGVGRVR